MAGRGKRRLQATLHVADIGTAIPKRLGGGTLKEHVEQEMPSGRVRAYALAYINPLIFSLDNGRVLGYDNSHGYSHRHFMGAVTPEPFVGWQHLRERFEREWREIAMKFVNGEST
jgi:hypothetical protein